MKNKVKVKTIRVLHRTSCEVYEDKINKFLEGKIFIDMKIVHMSSDHSFDVIILYQDKEENNDAN